MSDKKENPEKIPQSKKKEQSNKKLWTKEKMNEASPMPLPEIKHEEEKNEDKINKD